MSPGETIELLNRWHQGDRDALAALLQRDLPWIRARVGKRLGPLLRANAETVDYVQDAFVAALQYGPRFVVQDVAQFRALVARIVENTLRDQHDHHAALRRGGAGPAGGGGGAAGGVRVEPLPSGSVLALDPRMRSVTRPDEAAAHNELRAWTRLGLELLDPDDRRVILLREFEGLSFAAIGERLGIGETGARMRFTRAIPRLADKVKQLQAGELRDALGGESS